jgi:LmbE family N-acetylglucosaminyl deacetylase
VHQQPRVAHVVAAENVTCLVFAPGAPSAFAGRGAGAHLLETSTVAGTVEEAAVGQLVSIDISAYVAQKIAAVAAHRTQYPIAPDMLPLHAAMFGTEYFVRVYPTHLRQAHCLPEMLAHPNSLQLATRTKQRSKLPVPLV